MKRKLVLMSFAMMAGLPHAVLAKSSDKESATQSQIAWDGAYMPHYGKEGASHPLMDHLPATPSNTPEIIPNKWRLDFGMPSTEMVGAQESLPARGGRAGISLKMDF